MKLRWLRIGGIVVLLTLLGLGIYFGPGLFKADAQLECQVVVNLGLPRNVITVERQALIDLLQNYLFPQSYGDLWSEKYELTTLEEIRRFLKWEKTNQEFLPERINYVISLWGSLKRTCGWSKLALGLVGDQEGPSNIVIVHDGKGTLRVFEINPESDDLWPINRPRTDVVRVSI